MDSMESLINDFVCLKVSALGKFKKIKEQINTVTIGPNAEPLETSKSSEKHTNEAENNLNDSYQKENSETKVSPNGRKGQGLIRNDLNRIILNQVEVSLTKRKETFQSEHEELAKEASFEYVKTEQTLRERAWHQEQQVLNILKNNSAYDDPTKLLQIAHEKESQERQQRMQKEALVQDIMKRYHTLEAIHQEISRSYYECLAELNINFGEHFKTAKAFKARADFIVEQCNNNTVSKNDLPLMEWLLNKSNELKEIMIQDIRIKRAAIPKSNKTSVSENEQVSTGKTPTNLRESEPNQTANKSINAEKQISVTENKTSVVETQQKINNSSENNAQNQSVLIDNEVKKCDKQIEPSPNKINTSDLTSGNKISTNKDIKSNNINTSSDTTNNVKKPVKPLVSSFISQTALEVYNTTQKFAEDYANTYKELLNNPSLKQFRFNCKKAVNIPLNTISNISLHHMQSKYQIIRNLLKGNPVEVAGSRIVVSQHPQGLAYCTDLLAKKIVGQSDLITVDSTHIYAAILVSLWFEFPEFGNLVLYHFYESVPYLVPMYPPKLKSQTDEEYYRSLGYLYIDGEREEQDKFLSRMSDYMRLYAAIIVAKLKRCQKGTHPHGLWCGWRWLTETLNLEPRINITATLIFTFLEIAGNALQIAYGVQFQKMLIYLNEVYLPKIQKIDDGGPLQRLEIFLQKVLRSKYIEPPKGRISENAW